MIPVILSGGSGSRLWPVSRASNPKQFCEFHDRSFLQNTYDRLKSFGRPMVLTVKSMEHLTQRWSRSVGLSAEQILYEPMAKNTAPAVALLCHVLAQRGLEQEIVGLFPSDHLINEDARFAQAVQLACKAAEQGHVVTLGIQPRGPETGYGYIETTTDVLIQETGLKVCRVLGFREKPDRKTAEGFVQSGRYFWNAGMFVFRVAEMIRHFQNLQSELWQKIATIQPDLSNAAYVYAVLDAVSLDYAVMEKLKQQVCIPCDLGWSDVGSWDELARVSEEYSSLRPGVVAQVFTENSNNNYVFSIHNRVVGLIDVDDLLVVETPDATLVSKRGASQKVKNLLEQMVQAGLPEATEHPYEVRPWGRFEVLTDEKSFKVKKVTVDSGCQLSYQSHQRREEHWVIIQGEGAVTLNDQVHVLGVGQSIRVPAKAKHRIKNTGQSPLVFVEVQTGSYFGEDDIQRYQDDYNRI